jgi:hypothetical protein
MRILFTMPHFFGGGTGKHGSEGANPEKRSSALTQCIHALHQHFGTRQCIFDLAQRQAKPSNERSKAEVHVVVFTAGKQHLLDRLPVHRDLYQHYPVDVEPRMIAFQCKKMLRDRWGNYDYYCYLEDDLILHDPWLFAKLSWFNGIVGNDKVLLPNRFERGPGPLYHKAYVDGDLAPRVTARWQNVDDKPQLRSTVMKTPVLFQRPLNPHSGCYFLNAEQMEHWMRQPYFSDQDSSFVGPLESAATLGIMRAFKIYKPAPENASFLEIEHFGSQFISRAWTGSDDPA